jgi:anti-sigma factor RsiW
MNCEEVKELLYDYTKNEVSMPEISEIETHLKRCGACESELAHIKGISSLIKASMEEPHESVFLNISRSIRPALNKGLTWLKPALAAALVIFVAAGVYFYTRPAKVEIAEVPKEISESYAVVENTSADNSAEEQAAEDGNTYEPASYSGGNYTPVSYILGQD